MDRVAIMLYVVRHKVKRMANKITIWRAVERNHRVEGELYFVEMGRFDFVLAHTFLIFCEIHDDQELAHCQLLLELTVHVVLPVCCEEMLDKRAIP